MKIFRNRTVIGVLCILLALIICFGVTPLFSRSASEKTEIVRVTKDIKEGMQTARIWSEIFRNQARRRMRICVEPMPFPEEVALPMSLL